MLERAELSHHSAPGTKLQNHADTWRLSLLSLKKTSFWKLVISVDKDRPFILEKGCFRKLGRSMPYPAMTSQFTESICAQRHLTKLISEEA